MELEVLRIRLTSSHGGEQGIVIIALIIVMSIRSMMDASARRTGRRNGDRISQKWPVEKSVFGHDKEGRPLKSEIAEKSWLGRFISSDQNGPLPFFIFV